MYLGRPDIRQCSNSMSVQRRECDLVEVYDPNSRDAGACKCSCGMGADAAETDNDDEGRAELGKTGVGEKDAVPSELFEDQLIIVFTSSGSGGDLGAPAVLLACQRGWGCGAVFCELRIEGSV